MSYGQVDGKTNVGQSCIETEPKTTKPFLPGDFFDVTYDAEAYEGLSISSIESTWWVVSETRIPLDLVVQNNGRRVYGCIVGDWCAWNEGIKYYTLLCYDIVNEVVRVGNVELSFI